MKIEIDRENLITVINALRELEDYITANDGGVLIDSDAEQRELNRQYRAELKGLAQSLRAKYDENNKGDRQ